MSLGNKPWHLRVWQSHTGLWQFGKLAANGGVLSGYVQCHAGGISAWEIPIVNTSPISFSKFHNLIAGRLQALYSERIIAPLRSSSRSAFAPMAWDTNRDILQSHSCNRLSLVASCLMIFWTSDLPSVMYTLCHQLPFASFKHFSIFVFTLFILPSHFPDLITLRHNQLLFSFMYQWLPLDTMLLF